MTYTPRTLAQRWGCHPKTIKALIKREKLVPFRIGKLLRISAEEVGRYECAIALPSTKGASSLSSTEKTEHDTELRLRRLSGLKQNRKQPILSVVLPNGNQGTD